MQASRISRAIKAPTSTMSSSRLARGLGWRTSSRLRSHAMRPLRFWASNCPSKSICARHQATESPAPITLESQFKSSSTPTGSLTNDRSSRRYPSISQTTYSSKSPIRAIYSRRASRTLPGSTRSTRPPTCTGSNPTRARVNSSILSRSASS